MSRIKRIGIPVAAFAMAALAVATAGLAGDGRRPIHQPTDIVEPGYYYLTRNITANGVPAVTVSVDPNESVVLDLNCFGMKQLNSLVPVVHVSSAKSLFMKNGSITGGGWGVQNLSSIKSMKLNGLNFSGHGQGGIDWGAAKAFLARRVNVENQGGPAFRNSNFSSIKASGTLEDIVIRNAGGAGIEAVGLDSSSFDNISISGAGGAGVSITESSNIQVEGLRASGTAGPAMSASDVLNLFLVSSEIHEIPSSEILKMTRVAGANMDRVSVRGGSGTGLVLESVKGGRFTNLLFESTSGNSITIDPNSSGLTFAGITARNGGARGIEHAGDDSTFRALNFFSFFTDCAFMFTSSSERNHIAGSVARGSGSCPCTGTATAHLCDEGTANTSQGDNHVPTPY